MFFCCAVKSVLLEHSLWQLLVVCFRPTQHFLSLHKRYSEAEQHLLKAEKISQERSKIASVSDDNLDDWDTNVFMAIARSVCVSIAALHIINRKVENSRGAHRLEECCAIISFCWSPG